MAVSVEIKVDGINRIMGLLQQKYEVFLRYLDQALLQVCEDAVTYSVQTKGYKDHTSNLKNSLSFAFFKDGELVIMHEGKIPKPEEHPDGQQQVRANLEGYCAKEGVVIPKGYTLVIVPGMNYGKYVEAKGYNMVYQTRYFLEDEIQKVLQEALEVAKSA